MYTYIYVYILVYIFICIYIIKASLFPFFLKRWVTGIWIWRSACWEADRCDREKSIWSVTTGPDFLGVCLGLILTRVPAPPEEQDSYSRTARMEETGKPGLYEAHGASIQRYTAPATYIHTPPHTRTHTHTGNMRNTCARAYCNCIL